MANPLHPSGFRDHAFAWALVLSLGLHVLAITRLPDIHFEKSVPPATLTVELAAPATPEPAPEPAPEPPKPKSEPEPLPTPAPRRLPTPAPTLEPPPSSQAEPDAEPTPPSVITAAPKVESPPVFAAPPPPPEPPKPTEPSPQDLDAARNLYGNLLAREIAKHKQYPKIAQMRGWQGEAKIELQIDGSGNVLSSKIHDSSGFEMLDKQALEMVRKAAPFPAPPDALRGRLFNILVPVAFRLE